jgi:hypothetical protein
MRGYVAMIGCIIAAGCGSSDPAPCTVVDNGGSATITCPDGTSATVADGTDGQDGSAGTSGANGTNGTNGANGTNNHITVTIFCQGALPGTALSAQYWAGATAAGDVLARADVYGAALEFGASIFYAATQNGAATAEVTFTYDAAGSANGGWWRIGLNRSTLVQVVEYHDPDVASGLLAWTKDPSECQVSTY